MLFNTIFKKKIPVPSIKLPLTLMLLKNWILIKVTGSDAIQYLHNQLTCDIKNLNNHQYSFAAHCNSKGKMISNMYVFHSINKEIAFIEPADIYQKQISIMKKYAVFSNVTINPDNSIIFIGVAGSNARKYMNTLFQVLPNQTNTIVHYPNITLLYFHLPIERFLLIINNKTLLIDLLNKSQALSLQYNDHYQWTALDIEAGYPYISDKTSEFFFPQSANMNILKGINFNKGCYLGQELITRIQYRQLNKQSLYKLSGNLNENKENQLPTAGDHIELQINNQHWKKIGIILQCCKIKHNNIWIQAILNKSIEKYNKPCFRVIKIHNNTNILINIKEMIML